MTQKPSLSLRKRAIASEPLPTSTSVSYSKPPLRAKYSWSMTARSYAFVAPSVTSRAVRDTTAGSESGSSV
ncbi:hypothetical protein SHIRM173S_07548 [Streptomyces hirsutus]